MTPTPRLKKAQQQGEDAVKALATAEQENTKALETKTAATEAATAAAEMLKQAQAAQTIATREAATKAQDARPRNLNVMVPSNPITIKIDETPFTLNEIKPIKLKQGEATTFDVGFKRLYGFEDAATFTLNGLSGVGGLSLKTAVIDKGKSTVSAELSASTNATVGVHDFTMRSTYRFNNQNLSFDIPVQITVEMADPPPPVVVPLDDQPTNHWPSSPSPGGLCSLPSLPPPPPPLVVAAPTGYLRVRGSRRVGGLRVFERSEEYRGSPFCTAARVPARRHGPPALFCVAITVVHLHRVRWPARWQDTSQHLSTTSQSIIGASSPRLCFGFVARPCPPALVGGEWSSTRASASPDFAPLVSALYGRPHTAPTPPPDGTLLGLAPSSRPTAAQYRRAAGSVWSASLPFALWSGLATTYRRWSLAAVASRRRADADRRAALICIVGAGLVGHRSDLSPATTPARRAVSVLQALRAEKSPGPGPRPGYPAAWCSRLIVCGLTR